MENWLNISEFPSVSLYSPNTPPQLLFVLYSLNAISSCKRQTAQSLHFAEFDCDLEELKAPVPCLLAEDHY